MPRTHVIQSGDSLANIAYDSGLLVDTIWMHPDNAALRAQRPNVNILMPGDAVVIPDKRENRLGIATGQRHRFRLKDVPHVFQLQLFDGELPRDTQAYTLTVSGAGFSKDIPGTTDADGLLAAYIPPGVQQGRLTIGGEHEPLTLDILFGSLAPAEELRGTQQRLANLGYDCPVDGLPSEATTLAIEAFQRRFSLPITGEADAATCACLADMNETVRDFPSEPPPPQA